MLVKVNILDRFIEVSVGDGKQTFRWLASVVQSRIKQSNVLRSNYEDESYIVTEIRNAFGELLNPQDCIFEHSGTNGLTITAIVSTKFPVDEWENPELGDWLQGAHVHSKAGVFWSKEIDAWRSKLGEREGDEEGGVQRTQKQHGSTLVKIGYDFTASDIASAFELDWSNMRWDWLGAAAASEYQRSQLGDALKAHYNVVCNVFAHYCGVGQGECSVVV